MSKKTKEGYLQIATETYGGGIWPSWFDRDLSLAGRVIVSTPNAKSAYTSRLVKVDRPVVRIPTLAIHLDRSINEAFKFNKETEFRPIVGLVNEAVNARSGRATPATKEEGDVDMEERHHPLLLKVLADELGCEVSEIHDFEL